MPRSEAPLGSLSSFLPPGSYSLIEPLLLHYKVHLTVTRSRSTLLGDYRNAHLDQTHRISVNGNLNQYAFLITLLHELAHLITFVRYGHRVASHGKEWKAEYSALLKQFLQSSFFPNDISDQLRVSIQNPTASSCADDDLMRVLRNYDVNKEGVYMIEELEPGELFVIKGGRIFKRHDKVRKRIKAEDLETGKIYLFSPVYEVKKKD